VPKPIQRELGRSGAVEQVGEDLADHRDGAVPLSPGERPGPNRPAAVTESCISTMNVDPVASYG
jgi:hypothetical protein